MKAFYYIFIIIAIVSFVFAMAGFWWQGVICGISALMAYILGCDIAEQEKAEKKHTIQ